ncbi:MULTISPECIES: ABC transporter substrate-binding protein [Streptomyces]|uniref:ABC transporter substrate-binding protein n=1 Tax=Streptomyces evansiae TaxID=3075535 RepID=A0ABU2R834_9ACTN|nr:MULTISPECIES: ABC transporter substrate-binding protein [unclassified Streptomyces]MDT0412856.1 ABC transporter substrate-binding protein [Streptomyces sp. DSM 41979]MYQ59840.1 ABC transporter substrate-binding protein [Streptomyces sp. SID4926]SCE59874.1 ABC-type Fe3+-hydroxamate transport system, substrate-binding protein [Streptomyces sp. DfronAA-171]
MSRPLASAPSRRRVLGSAAGILAAAGLAACSSDSDDGGNKGTESPGASGTRTVDTAKGKVKVPARPKRVVAINDFPMSAMFDMGLTPAGVFNAGEEYVPARDLQRWRAVPKVSDGVGGEIQVEKVAALRPDLVIGIDAQTNLPYKQLSALAPTVLLPFSRSKSPWLDMAEQTADVLGEHGRLDALKKEYETKAAAVREKHAKALAATHWALLQGGFDEGQWWLYGHGSPIGGILADAGAVFSSASRRLDVQQAVSYELIANKLADADAVFYYTTNDGKPANLGPKLFAQPAFEKLAATKADKLFGSIYFLPGGMRDAIAALDDFDKALRKL